MMKNNLKKAARKSINLLLFLSIFFNSIEISANIAAPSQGGIVSAEPSGLENIFISRETLTIDFRPLGEMQSVRDNKSVLVEAVYEVENKGEDKDLKLVFVVGSKNVEDFEISIDDKKVEKTETVENSTLPKSWQTPLETPWENDRKLMYNPSSGQIESVSFALSIPKGKHTIKATYRSEAAVYSNLGKMKAFQFAYILAPAREWADFGGLEISVFLPANWKAETLPQLTREGDVLKGNFAQIPADSLAVTVQPPLPANYDLFGTIYNALFIFVIFGFPLFLIIFAWLRGYKLNLAWLYGIGLAVLWAILFFAAGFLSIHGADYKIPEVYFARYGYDDFFSGFFLIVMSVILVFVGFGLWMLTTFMARKSAAKKEIVG